MEGGRRVERENQAMVTANRAKKPTTRMVQPYPICGINLLTMMGKMMPPVEEPDATTPSARPRRRLK